MSIKFKTKAYSQLIQFYPQTKPLIKGKTDDYVFAGKIYISEYLLPFIGISDEVIIDSPQELKKIRNI